jgi:RNA polymerase sigma-70 factor (ECF subfamily)
VETASPHPALSLDPDLLTELHTLARAGSFTLSPDEFRAILLSVGRRHNFGAPPAHQPAAIEQAVFLRSLNLPDLALAHACALGRDIAWQHFIERYREPLLKFAIKISNSTTHGHELTGSLYADLFGLAQHDVSPAPADANQAVSRKSPLASYSGRGALLVWLRAILAQRFVDHHRRTRRDLPLDDREFLAPETAPSPSPETLAQLTTALTHTLAALSADDRLLLSAYFIDQSTLAQIARLTSVHEATVSRRLKRLTAVLHTQMLQNLQNSGLKPRAASEALRTDPRDLSINLRSLLQYSPATTFPQQEILPEAEPK